jgi:NADPH:quinone reductase-like Zn-dependent oxidoreductase
MQAWCYEEWGGPEVLRMADCPVPEVDTGGVLVRVGAASVNPADHRLRSGGGQVFPHRFPIVAGLDFAGTIVEVGSAVDRFEPGQRVFGYIGLACLATGGSWAEYVAVNADSLALTPAAITDDVAAAIGCAGTTAMLMADELRIGEGDTVLVHGAAGGVGHLLVQLARHRGATVVGTASSRNFEYLDSLGAIPVVRDVDRDNALDVVGTGEFDAIADLTGARSLGPSIARLRVGGRVATLAQTDLAGVPRVGATPNPEYLDHLVDLVARDIVRVRIHDVVPFAGAAEALAVVEAGAALGKLVVAVKAHPRPTR